MSDLELARGEAVRVLVVEDNPGDAELAAIALEEATTAFTVAGASSIASALDELPGADVVLLDLGLPDSRHLEGLARLRAADPDVTIIILTGGADIPLAEAALASGAQDYLLKDDLHTRSLERAIRHARSRQDLLRRIEASERWAQALVHSVSDVISIHRADGEIIHLGGLAGAVLPWSDRPSMRDVRSHVDRATWRAMIRAFRRWRQGDATPVEFAVQTGEGDERHFESVATNMLDDPVIAGIVVVSRDVTDRHAIQDRLSHEATHDSLTGLPNRALFQAQLRTALSRQLREQNTVAVLLVDLDDFKKINDSYGHAAGDEVLRSAGMLLSVAVRDGDTLARIGGDEFVIVCPDVTPEVAERISRRLQRSLVRPFSVGGHDVHIGASVGIAMAPPGFDGGPQDLFRNADIALYEAKAGGGGRVCVFNADLEHRAYRRMELETELRGAITRYELSLVYQPIVSLDDGHVVGHEALLRWHHPRLGDVAPDEFIPVAESTGLIVPIGRWVAERACVQLAAWRRAGIGLDAHVAVNVSARQLSDPEFVDGLAILLERTQLPPQRLCLEVTETALIGEFTDPSVTLGRLRVLGVRIALDDFGTGYSSLTYLRRLPVDVLKIDRSFIEGIAENDDDRALVSSVVRMARALDVQVVAEGIEHPGQRDALRALGCNRAQGFLWSPGLHPDDASELLSRVFDPGTVVAEFPDEPVGVVGIAREAGSDDVFALVAHELMQPMAVIKAFSENFRLLAGTEQVTDLSEIADAIDRNAVHAIEVLQALADNDALERGVLRLETTTTSLLTAVTQALDDLRGSVPVPIDLQSGRDLAVDLDRARFRQILANLLSNAGKFSPPGTRIVVRAGAHADGSHAEIAVVDSGPGVPPDRHPELFTKFGKLGRHRGTGIGLYVSRQLARLHGGDIRYRRADTGGAQFTVTLPLAGTAAAAAVDGASERAAPAPPPAMRSSVYDDAQALRSLHAATRALLSADVPERVVSITIGLVRLLGGTVVPADAADPTALPIDLAMGEGPPLLAAAPPMSVARLRLERLLPLFAEDARDAMQLARAVVRDTVSFVDPATGLVDQRGLRRVMRERDRHGDLVAVAIRPPAGDRDGRRTAARLLRSVSVEGDAVVAWDGGLVVAVRPGAMAAEELLDPVQEQWLAWGADAPLVIGVAAGVGDVEGLIGEAVDQIGKGT